MTHFAQWEINIVVSIVMQMNLSYPKPYTQPQIRCHLIYPLRTSKCSKGLIAQHTSSSIRLQEFRVSFRVTLYFGRTPEILYCTVSIFFPLSR